MTAKEFVLRAGNTHIPPRTESQDVFVALRTFINCKLQIPRSPGPWVQVAFQPMPNSNQPNPSLWSMGWGPGKGLSTSSPTQRGLGATTGVLQASCSVFHCPKLEYSHASALAETTQPPNFPQSRVWPRWRWSWSWMGQPEHAQS